MIQSFGTLTKVVYEYITIQYNTKHDNTIEIRLSLDMPVMKKKY